MVLAKGEGREGVNFINVLHVAFMLTDHKSAKKTVKTLVSFFAFSGSALVKAARKTMVKLTRGLFF